MNWFTGLMVFVIIWWLVLFMVLPWGIRVPDKPEPGHATSAPERPMLWRKALITTAIACVLWVIAYFVIESDLVTFRVS
ncbi:MAG: DUF1467 family protein [Kiloniellales bacterium]|nr:DUF1467 family protein [Kiloniellales bacterium]